MGLYDPIVDAFVAADHLPHPAIGHQDGRAEMVTPPECEGVIARFRIGAYPFVVAFWRPGITTP